MSQAKDPAIKLFGRNISVPEFQIPATPPSKNRCSDITEGEIVSLDKNDSREADKSAATSQGIKDIQAPIGTNEVPDSNPSEDQVETINREQEKFKKPDKILPCPRCNSLDTKFCYFNNYNVNQPRHFCKNCQRYWTAGGTMRNVPIGAGRRKNKHLPSQFRQILVSSDGVPNTRMENSDTESHQMISSAESVTTLRPAVPGNGMVLKFSSEAPLCESMEKALNLGDQKRYGEMKSASNQDDIEEASCGSAVASTMSQGSELSESVRHKRQFDMLKSSNEIKVPHPPCYPVPPWLFPWNPGWSGPHSTPAAAPVPGRQSCVSTADNTNHVQWCSTPIIAVPGFYPPSIPLQLVPASYLSYMPVFAAGTMSPNGSHTCPSPASSTSTSCCSGNGSPKLGKHSRDLNHTDEEQAENHVLVPKTLRIDDPNEISNSPLWAATLSLKPEKKIPIAHVSVFKTFDTKVEGKGRVTEASPILEANPAALSRANTFQESS